MPRSLFGTRCVNPPLTSAISLECAGGAITAPVAVCVRRSGAAVRKDAELVPFWVGKYDPAVLAGLADVGVPGT